MVGRLRSAALARCAPLVFAVLVLAGLSHDARADDSGFGAGVARLVREAAADGGLALDPVAHDADSAAPFLPAAETGSGRIGGIPREPGELTLQAPGLDPWTPPEKKFWIAFGEAMITQAVPWSINSFVRGESWSRDIGWSSWANNYARSFEWDDNQFVNNQFSHPYHGNLYYNAARSNGFDYWESMAFAFLNSWLWEYHGETFRPAVNDWFKTSLGGTAIGEMTHRIAEKVTNNSAQGGGRTWGELAGMLINPVRGFDRLVKGQWGRQWENSPDRLIPVRSHFEIGAFGAKEVANFETGDEEAGVTPLGETEFVPFEPAEKVRLSAVRFDLRYGDAFRKHDAPYDAFEFEIQAAFGSEVAALNQIRIRGWLHMHQYDWSERNRHGFVVTQRYQYFNNEVLQYGAQSFGFGLNSLFFADKKTRLRTLIEGQAHVLAAIDSPYAEQVGRTYDYGPGLGLSLEARVERDGFDYVRLNLGSTLVHTINGGGEGDHHVAFGSLRVMAPIFGRFGIGGEYGYVRRDGFFKDLPDLKRDYDYARVFVTWVTR